jgi:hypothetical protein
MRFLPFRNGLERKKAIANASERSGTFWEVRGEDMTIFLFLAILDH